MRRKRQTTDAAAGGGEQGIGDGRRNDRHADFAQAAGLAIAVDEFDQYLRRLRQVG